MFLDRSFSCESPKLLPMTVLIEEACVCLVGDAIVWPWRGIERCPVVLENGYVAARDVAIEIMTTIVKINSCSDDLHLYLSVELWLNVLQYADFNISAQ